MYKLTKIHKCTNTLVHIGQDFTHVELDEKTLLKQREHIFTLTNNRMFELLVFERKLENI